MSSNIKLPTSGQSEIMESTFSNVGSSKESLIYDSRSSTEDIFTRFKRQHCEGSQTVKETPLSRSQSFSQLENDQSLVTTATDTHFPDAGPDSLPTDDKHRKGFRQEYLRHLEEQRYKSQEERNYAKFVEDFHAKGEELIRKEDSPQKQPSAVSTPAAMSSEQPKSSSILSSILQMLFGSNTSSQKSETVVQWIYRMLTT